MSGFGRLCDRVPLSDITKRSGQHVNYENSVYGQEGGSTKLGDARCQRDNEDCAVHSAATVMGNPYIPGVMRLQEQGSSEPSELNCGYHAPTAKNIGDLNGAHFWAQAHPEAQKMIRTSLELLMSQSRKAQPNFSDSSYGGDLTNATGSEVHGTVYSSKGNKMIQMPLELLMSQSRNVFPPNFPGSTYAAEMASFANPQVHNTAYSSNGHWMIQTPMDLPMSQHRNVGLPNSTGSAVGANITSSQIHGTAYSSRVLTGHTMIQTPLEMLTSQNRNACPPNLSGSYYGVEFKNVANPQVHSTTYPSRGHNMIQTPLEMLMAPGRSVCPPNLSGSIFGVELASAANPQVHNTAYSSRGHRMIQPPMDLLKSKSRNVGLPNSTVSSVAGEPTNIPSSQVHGTAYSSKGHNMIQTPLAMLMSQSRNICPPNLPGSSCGMEFASAVDPQVHNTTCTSRGNGMIQTPMDQLMSQKINVGVPNSTVSSVGGEPTKVPSSQVHCTADSSSSEHGTDDDLLTPYPNSRDVSGIEHVSGDGRAIVPASSQARAQTDMEAIIHQLEQEAYCSVLRAFKAQSDTITWEKEGLITELREQLKVSDEAHRQLLNRINNDDLIHSIREWRTTGGLEECLPNNPTHDPVSGHTTSAHKRQKTSKSITASLPPPPVMYSQLVATPTQPSSSTDTKAVLGSKGKRTKPCQKVPEGSALKPTSSSEGPSSRGPHMNRYFPGGPAAEFSEAQNVNPLIGRKVMNRWPDDNSFYEVVISDYNPETGLYALVYDINTSNETWEWVDLKKMGPEDIRWLEDESGIDPVMYLQSQTAPGSGARKSPSYGGLMPGHGRGRSNQKNVSKMDFPRTQNSVRKRVSGDIDILHTESLTKLVEKVCSARNPDPLKVEEAKKALKEQENSLVDAIARLAEASDDESV